MIRAKYKGDGAGYHTGIPARDISEEEWDSLPDELKATASASPLYELRGEARREGEQAERKVDREATKPKGGEAG